MNARAGIDVVHVPYRGIADATKDLLGGTIQAMTASIPATLPLAADKRVKVLAVTGAKRIPQLPDVPSWQEEGVANAERRSTTGASSRRSARRASRSRRLNAEVQKVLAQPDVRERLEREGAELIPGPPERLGALIAGDLAQLEEADRRGEAELRVAEGDCAIACGATHRRAAARRPQREPVADHREHDAEHRDPGPAIAFEQRRQQQRDHRRRHADERRRPGADALQQRQVRAERDDAAEHREVERATAT